MAISFNKALGVHEQALTFRARRVEVLANNLVNVDTPNFKARDIDFASVLKTQMHSSTGAVRMISTNGRHIAPSATAFSPELMYRNPLQPSLDGNTVDENVEMSKFSQNSMDYQASFQFLNGKFKGLTNAIRGDI